MRKNLAWPYRSARRLGAARLYDLAIGTTGYVNTGSGNHRRLADQITHDWSRAGFADADLIVIANGYNDKAGAAGSLAILTAIQGRRWQAGRPPACSSPAR